jgi:hypothetical protein
VRRLGRGGDLTIWPVFVTGVTAPAVAFLPREGFCSRHPRAAIRNGLAAIALITDER